MSFFGRLLNRSTTPGMPSGVPLSRQIEVANRYRDQYNPLRSLTITRAITLLEAGQRGEFADLHWAYRSIERRDEDLIALVERRTSALLQMDWNIKAIDERTATARGTRYDSGLAEAQAATLRAAYERIENLYEAVECLAMASFREFGIAQFVSGDQVALPGTATRIEPVDTWNIVRDGLAGGWYWNGEGRSTTAKSLGEANKLDPQFFLIRTWPRPLDEIAFIKFVRANMSRKDWDAFIEIYGIPAWIVTMPDNVPADKAAEYQAAAQAVAQGGSGALPAGSTATAADQPRGVNPFRDHLQYLTEKLVLAGTGGLLTMLAAPGSGTLAGSAHMEAFDIVARGEARKIGEIFQRQFDKVVLDAAFPGSPRLAYFEIAANEEQDVGEILDHAVKIKAAGGQPDWAQLSEKTGYTITAAPAAPAQISAAPGQPMFNRRRRADALLNASRDAASDVQDELLTASTDLYSKALQADFKPVAQRLAACLEIEDAGAMLTALKALQRDLPKILKELNADPAQAAALEQAMTAALFNGAAEGTVAREVAS